MTLSNESCKGIDNTVRITKTKATDGRISCRSVAFVFLFFAWEKALIPFASAHPCELYAPNCLLKANNSLHFVTAGSIFRTFLSADL